MKINNSNKQNKNIEYYISILNKYKNYVYAFLTALIITVGGYYYYKNIYLPDLEIEAADQLYTSALNYFKQDSLQLALNGDGQNFGFNEIISEYSGTKSADIASYYAGISEYKLGNYETAIDRLNSFKSDEDILNSVVKSLIGDCYSQLKQYDEALTYYEYAADICQEKNLKSMFLFKASQMCIELNKFDLSLEHLQKIKTKLKGTYYYRDIDKYISMVKSKK